MKLKRSFLRRSGGLIALTLLACGVATAAEEVPGWSQWRGPDGQGHAPAATNLPLEWSDTENIRWKTPLPGRGWSSPVLAGGRLWMTTAVETPLSEEEQTRLAELKSSPLRLSVSGPVSLRALCVEAETGKLLHDIECLRVEKPAPIHALNSHASPSPVILGTRLYCHFGTNGTACIDTATAALLWTQTDQQINHENGPGSTPILFRDRLIFHCDGSDRQYIVALDTATGNVVWRTERSGTLNADPQLKKAYGTPLLTELEGRIVLLSPAADWLYAYDPLDGRELWKIAYGGLGFSIVPRPVVGHGMVYLSTSFMQPELLAVKLPHGSAVAEIAWRVKKSVPTMPSPLLVGQEIYIVSDKGVATCLDALTGDVRWSERLGGNFCSSPLLADGRIYVGNREGETFVIAPGTSFQLLATNRLEGEIMASPVAVPGTLYLRTDQALYRIEQPAAGR